MVPPHRHKPVNLIQIFSEIFSLRNSPGLNLILSRLIVAVPCSSSSEVELERVGGQIDAVG